MTWSEAGLDLLATRGRRDQDGRLVGLEHQLEQPDRLPLGHRVDAADDDRSWLVVARVLLEEPLDERSDGDVLTPSSAAGSSLRRPSETASSAEFATAPGIGCRKRN